MVKSLESARADEWDNVVSCHAGHGSVQTWNLQRYSIGKHTLTSKHSVQGARPQVNCLYGYTNVRFPINDKI